jgi:C4-dicarboxylate-binding protein DctP
MKKSFLYMLLACLGLALIVYLGYHNLFPQAEPPYDDDQEGLNDQIVFKFSHVVAENTPKGQAAAKFAELVAEKSDGKIQIVVFPNGSLYSDIEEINALKDGQVQIIAPSTSKLSELSPKWGVLDLPFAFSSYEAMKQGIHGTLGQKLLDSLQEQKIKGLAHWSNGFKQFTTNIGPLREPAALKGQKLRIMPSEIIQAQFNLLGVETHEDSFNSTYNLIEEGKVDGEENTISNIYSKKFYNVQKHLTISNHGYLGYAVMMDQKVWDQQTENTHRILLEAMEETTAWNDQNAIQINEEQLELIKQTSDIQIHELTASEKQRWAEKLAPMYERSSGKIGKDLLEELKMLQEKYGGNRGSQ